MKNTSKSVLAALALMVVGVFTFAQPVLRVGADWLLGSSLTTTTHPITSPFTSISITELDSDVQLVHDPKGEARVVFQEYPDAPHTVTVEGGVLTISLPDQDRTDHLLIRRNSEEDPQFTLYLPDTSYESLTFESVSGDLETSRQLTFQSVTLTSVSGDLELSGTVAGTVTAETTSGDIELRQAQAGAVEFSSTSGDLSLEGAAVTGKANLSTTSGDLELKNSQAAELVAVTTSGDVELERVTISGNAQVTTTSGDIELEQYLVQGSSTLETRSGRVKGAVSRG